MVNVELIFALTYKRFQEIGIRLKLTNIRCSVKGVNRTRAKNVKKIKKKGLSRLQNQTWGFPKLCHVRVLLTKYRLLHR